MKKIFISFLWIVHCFSLSAQEHFSVDKVFLNDKNVDYHNLNAGKIEFYPGLINLDSQLDSLTIVFYMPNHIKVYNKKYLNGSMLMSGQFPYNHASVNESGSAITFTFPLMDEQQSAACYFYAVPIACDTGSIRAEVTYGLKGEQYKKSFTSGSIASTEPEVKWRLQKKDNKTMLQGKIIYEHDYEFCLNSELNYELEVTAGVNKKIISSNIVSFQEDLQKDTIQIKGMVTGDGLKYVINNVMLGVPEGVIKKSAEDKLPEEQNTIQYAVEKEKLIFKHNSSIGFKNINFYVSSAVNTISFEMGMDMLEADFGNGFRFTALGLNLMSSFQKEFIPNLRIKSSYDYKRWTLFFGGGYGLVYDFNEEKILSDAALFEAGTGFHLLKSMDLTAKLAIVNRSDGVTSKLSGLFLGVRFYLMKLD